MADRCWQQACGWLLAVGMAVSTLLAPPHCRAQDDARLPAPRPIPKEPVAPSVPPGPGPAILPANFGGYLPPALPVTLVDVLKLTILANLDIVQARLAVERARVGVLRANAQFLPNANLGSTYVRHDGQIQNTAGNVQTVDRDSLFVGGGPSMALDISSALFGPNEARLLLTAARFGENRVTNETLLQVADAYFAVLRVRRQLARLDEVLDFLTSEKSSPLRGDEPGQPGPPGLLPMVTSQVKALSASPSDQARVEADVVRFTEDRIRQLEAIRVASAELARLLHLDAEVFLLPNEDFRWPVDIPGGVWFNQPFHELVGLGLRSRPELAENQALIEAAVARYRTVKYRPLLPNLIVNYSFGGFGGGPPIVGKTKSGSNILGNSGIIADFGTRDDFDISLVWRLQNLGLGNLAQIRDARLQLEQTRVYQLQLQDRVIAQIVQALESVQRGKQRVELTGVGLFDGNKKPDGAIYYAVKSNFLRAFKEPRARAVLEVQDSIRRLNDVLLGYANALTDYDQARFRLLIALGMPAPAIIDPRQMPLPCGPPPEEGKATPTPTATSDPGSPATSDRVLPKAPTQAVNDGRRGGVPLPPIAAPAAGSALPDRRNP